MKAFFKTHPIKEAFEKTAALKNEWRRVTSQGRIKQEFVEQYRTVFDLKVWLMHKSWPCRLALTWYLKRFLLNKKGFAIKI
jgi:hypothetical protein